MALGWLNLWIRNHGHRGLRVRRADSKLPVDFRLCGRVAPLMAVLFEGELYLHLGSLRQDDIMRFIYCWVNSKIDLNLYFIYMLFVL